MYAMATMPLCHYAFCCHAEQTYPATSWASLKWGPSRQQWKPVLRGWEEEMVDRSTQGMFLSKASEGDLGKTWKQIYWCCCCGMIYGIVCQVGWTPTHHFWPSWKGLWGQSNAWDITRFWILEASSCPEPHPCVQGFVPATMADQTFFSSDWYIEYTGTLKISHSWSWQMSAFSQQFPFHLQQHGQCYEIRRAFQEVNLIDIGGLNSAKQECWDWLRWSSRWNHSWRWPSGSALFGLKMWQELMDMLTMPTKFQTQILKCFDA